MYIHTLQTRYSRWRGRVGRGSLAVVMAAFLVAVGVAPAAASAQTASLTVLPVGTVVTSAPMTLPAVLQPIATGKKITYVSTNSQNQKIIVSGAVMTPKVQPLAPKVVAWAHGTTGMADQCAPSKNLNVFWPEAVSAVKSYLEKGWTVAATDYPGLGTSGAHPYLIGDSEARSVIDSVRAARKLDAKLTNNWVVSGHSQGGQAALFAGEIADTYGGGLNLKGVVAIAPVSHEEFIAAGIPGTPGQGYLVMALFGLAAVDSTVDPYAILAEPARDRLGVLSTGCLEEILTTYAPLTAEELVVGGVVPEVIGQKLAARGNPAQQASTVPVLLVQGTADQDVPADFTVLLQEAICSYDVKTYLHLIEGADHVQSVFQSTGFVADYIKNRFLGLPAPSNC